MLFRSSNIVSDSIQANIGDLTLLLTQQHVNDLLAKIWNLDFHTYKELDLAIRKYFDEEGKRQKILLDKSAIIDSIRSTAFFKFPDGNMLSYNTFRQDWQYYVGPDKPLNLPGKRKEFVQFLTNHYKPNWVKSNGTCLTEEEFQILYRLEREPRSIERILEYIEANYFTFVQKDSMEEYLTKIRVTIAKIIKDQLLNLVKTEQSKRK